jgi:hypothetical protein
VKADPRDDKSMFSDFWMKFGAVIKFSYDEE